MKLRISQVAFGLAERTLSATGKAMGVWEWGCSLQCPGCASPHTWSARSFKDAVEVEVDELLRLIIERNPGAFVLTGGEPSEQPAGSLALVRGFKHRFPDREAVLYSGLRFAKLQKQHPELAAAFDVVVAGPFVQSLARGQALLGSSNQEVVLQTPLAEGLYTGWQKWGPPRLQLSSRVNEAGDIELVTVGIPRPATSPTTQAKPIQWHGRSVRNPN